ncbi:MAG: hypothetical protein M1820_004053 [Bogoriella megaspora]|nr:MAG: hypothetical protein M1820_004053 [Bogoriella megaspora]
MAFLTLLLCLFQAGVMAIPAKPLSSIENRAADATGVQMFPTINMTDTTGKPIQAHGGDIVQDSGYYYWFGEDKTGETTSGTFRGVNCYRSTDFSTWEYRGAVLSPISGTNISSSSIVERPKVIYNEANKNYVMWFHCDSSNYGVAMAGVAVSSQIDGKYTFQRCFKPFGTDSRDETVWKDPDTKVAYFSFASTNNADLKIASLTSDYLNVNQQVYIWTNKYWEAPGFLKIDGKFFILYSRQDGWNPADNYWMSATSMSGPWSNPVLLAPTGYYAYNTQNAYDISIKGSSGTVYLYLGDHWNAKTLGASTYSFYPITYSGGSIKLEYSGGWSLNAGAGTWSNLSSTVLTTNDFTVTPSNALLTCGTCASGHSVNMTSTSSLSFKWNGSAGNKVFQISYIYNPGGEPQDWKLIDVKVDGADKGTAMIESTRSSTIYFQAPIRVTSVATGSTVTLKLTTYTGTDVRISSVSVYDTA